MPLAKRLVAELGTRPGPVRDMSRKRPNRRLVAELQWAADTPVDTLQATERMANVRSE